MICLFKSYLIPFNFRICIVLIQKKISCPQSSICFFQSVSLLHIVISDIASAASFLISAYFIVPGLFVIKSSLPAINLIRHYYKIIIIAFSASRIIRNLIRCIFTVICLLKFQTIIIVCQSHNFVSLIIRL